MKLRTFMISILAAVVATAGADRLVILHTNDTHSNVEPDVNGVGGVLQRKAIFDSVRQAEKHVLLIDAGDMVQGTLFFKFFGGDVEYPLMDMQGYDIRVLGNHEFDNGLESMANHYRNCKGERLSANYDFTGTAAEGLFKPYTIKKVAGKKIGLMGINVDPRSLIAAKNIEGMKFLPIIETANRVARELKHDKGCDLVVAVTHIGYSNEPEPERETDVMLAAASRDIDIIIGGHSHTLVKPEGGDKPSLINNADGRPIRVAQTGKYGRYIGKIEVDLNRLEGASGKDFKYELIPVTDRFSAEKLDTRIVKFLEPFRQSVDSVNAHVIAFSAADLSSSSGVGGYPNFTADFGLAYGRHIADSLTRAGQPMHVDLSIMNCGGIRQDMPKGPVTEGQILSTFPFSNYMVISALKGSDIVEAMKVSARRGGEAVSANVRVVTDGDYHVQHVLVDGHEIDPDRIYNVMTIDYLSAGNDGLVSLANGTELWRSNEQMSAPILEYVATFGRMGLPIEPDMVPRFVVQQPLD